MPISEAEWYTFGQRFAAIRGEDILALLREAHQAGDLNEARVRGFVDRVWTAYRNQRRAVLQAQRGEIDRELGGLG